MVRSSIRRRAGAVLVGLLVVLAACGSDDTGDEPATQATTPSPELGAIRAEDLPAGEPFGDWSDAPTEESPEAGIDGDLPACAVPSSFPDAVNAGTQAVSPTYTTSVSGAVRTSALARSFAVALPDRSAAEAAFDAIDADAVGACIASSVDPGATEQIEVREGSAEGGDAAKVFATTLDDFTFFEGNDNEHSLVVSVHRVGDLVVVAQFVYSGQYFEDVEDDLATMERDVVAAVVERVAG